MPKYQRTAVLWLQSQQRHHLWKQLEEVHPARLCCCVVTSYCTLDFSFTWWCHWHTSHCLKERCSCIHRCIEKFGKNDLHKTLPTSPLFFFWLTVRNQSIPFTVSLACNFFPPVLRMRSKSLPLPFILLSVSISFRDPGVSFIWSGDSSVDVFLWTMNLMLVSDVDESIRESSVRDPQI